MRESRSRKPPWHRVRGARHRNSQIERPRRRRHPHSRGKVSGLAGFLLAKTAAAFSRRKTKDWYDIAFVLLHNDAGGTAAAVALVEERFIGEIAALQTALDDLEANFQNLAAQGARAYVTQMRIDHPELDSETLAADAVVAVGEFCQGVRHPGN